MSIYYYCEVDTAADNNLPKGWLLTLGADTRTLAAVDFGYADLLTATAKGSPRNPRQYSDDLYRLR